MATMNETVVVGGGVPSLDEIARDPRLAAGLPANVARALLARAVVAQGALITPALAAPTGAADPAPGPATEDELLTLEEAARRIGRHPRWFTRRPLPFVKRLSRRTIRVSRRGLERWVAQKA